MAARSEDASDRTAPGCVLVIDDEPSLRLLLRRILERQGYEVLSAAGGAEGLRCFADQRARISAVILDLVMPGISGAEVFDEIRSLDPDVPILLSSGRAADAAVESRLAGGGAHFLEKPYGREQLVDLLSRALAESPRGAPQPSG